MNAQLIDLVFGTTFQGICVILIFLNNSPWLLPLSIFVGMWTAMGIWRGLYNQIKQRLPNKEIKEK